VGPFALLSLSSSQQQLDHAAGVPPEVRDDRDRDQIQQGRCRQSAMRKAYPPTEDRADAAAGRHREGQQCHSAKAAAHLACDSADNSAAEEERVGDSGAGCWAGGHREGIEAETSSSTARGGRPQGWSRAPQHYHPAGQLELRRPVGRDHRGATHHERVDRRSTRG